MLLQFNWLRWEQWAIYQLSNEDHDPFQFQLEDYAKQHHWKALEENTARLISKGEKSAGEQVAKRLEELRRQETEDVLRAMKAYYEAFNKKNMEHLLSFWLPNDQSELTLPGVPKMKGLRGVEEAYRQIFHGVFPMCTIEPHILGVQTFGNVAVVFTLEVPRKGADQRDTKKATPASANAHQDRTQDPRPMQGPLPDLPMLLSKMFFPQLGSRNKQTSSSSLSPEQGGSPASKSPSRILSMTTLRHTNQMWRIWSHHTTMIDSAAFLGNAGYLSSEHREVLTDHLIHGLVTNQQSAVEVAYEVIFGYNLPPGMRRLSKSPLSPANAAAATATLKRFADQCKRLASQLPLP
eukprot:gene15696-11236_t